MTRFLAMIHVVLALAAFGIGNVVMEAPRDAPAILHLGFGATLLLCAVALWRSGRGIRWAVLLNLTVGALVLLTLLLDRVEGATGTSWWLVGVALAFVVLEGFTLKYTQPFTRDGRDLR